MYATTVFQHVSITLLEICTKACIVSLPGQNKAKMKASSSNDQKAYIITGAVFQHVPTTLLEIF